MKGPALVALLLLTGADSPRAPAVTALAFAPDGLELAVAAGGSVSLRDLKDAGGGMRTRKAAAGLGRVMALAFQESGIFLAAGGGTPGESGETVLFDMRGPMLRASLAGHEDLVMGVAFGSGLLAEVSADGTGRVHSVGEDAGSTKTLFRLLGHAGPVLAVSFAPDDRWIVTAGADRSVKVWSAEDGALVRSMNHHLEPVNALAFRPAPRGADPGSITCATGSNDRTVRVWQPATGRMVRIVRKHEGAVLALVYSPDGESIYTAGAEGVIRKVDAGSDEVTGALKAHEDWIHAIALSPDGKTLASGDASGAVKLWAVRKEGLEPAAAPSAADGKK